MDKCIICGNEFRVKFGLCSPCRAILHSNLLLIECDVCGKRLLSRKETVELGSYQNIGSYIVEHHWTRINGFRCPKCAGKKVKIKIELVQIGDLLLEISE